LTLIILESSQGIPGDPLAGEDIGGAAAATGFFSDGPAIHTDRTGYSVVFNSDQIGRLSSGQR
jgi:hypothetical protein